MAASDSIRHVFSNGLFSFEAKREIVTSCNYLTLTVEGVKPYIFLWFRPCKSLEVSRMGRPE